MSPVISLNYSINTGPSLVRLRHILSIDFMRVRAPQE